MRRIVFHSSGISLLFGLVLASSVLAETRADFSEANQLLFFSDHLRNIEKPITLRYRFEKKGSLEEGFTDQVDVQIQELHENGSKRVRIKYFTGARQRHIPAIDGATGNPLLTVFLQRDVREMARLTGGHWRHFQKQIKLALEETAQVTAAEIKLAGRQLSARNIVIHPYRDDPMVERFQEYRGKYYVFTLIEALPGEVYEIRAVTPSAEGNPLVEESLTYIEAEADA